MEQNIENKLILKDRLANFYNQNRLKIFFLISNFGVWAGSGMYSKNFTGLINCYAAGIPFIHNTIISDFLFTTVLFGSYYLLQSEYSILKIKHLKYS